MKIWLDAQLSPAIARWMEEAFDIEAVSAMRRGSLVLRTSGSRSIVTTYPAEEES